MALRHEHYRNEPIGGCKSRPPTRNAKPRRRIVVTFAQCRQGKAGSGGWRGEEMPAVATHGAGWGILFFWGNFGYDRLGFWQEGLKYAPTDTTIMKVSMPITFSRQLARFVNDLSLTDLPLPVIDKAKARVRRFLGVRSGGAEGQAALVARAAIERDEAQASSAARLTATGTHIGRLGPVIAERATRSSLRRHLERRGRCPWIDTSWKGS
jgi:hypothetical protein